MIKKTQGKQRVVKSAWISHSKESAANGFTLAGGMPHRQRNQSMVMILLMEEILHWLYIIIYIYIYGHNATHHHLIMYGIFTILSAVRFLSINSTSQYRHFVGVRANKCWISTGIEYSI